MDLETLLTSRAGFGLESASFLQRATARIADGAPLDDLVARATESERSWLRTALGCEHTALPTGAPPTEFVNIGPIRTAKSLFAAAAAFARAITADVSIIKPGEEPPRISILATSLDNARAVRGHLNIVSERSKLRTLMVGQDADSVTIRHPSGMPIEIRVIAAHRGGYSLASRWSASVVFDEAPTWQSNDKIVSLEESRDQALGRLLPGAQCFYLGSPWQSSGWCFTTHAQHFGKPTPELVVIKPEQVGDVTPAQQLNPVYWTPERVARVQKSSSRSYRMQVLNAFGAAASCYELEDLEQAFKPCEFEIVGADRPVVLCDPSSGKKDRWTFCFMQKVYTRNSDDAWAYPASLFFEGGMARHTRTNPIGYLEVVDGYPPIAAGKKRARPFWSYWGWHGFEPNGASAEEIVAHVAIAARRVGARVAYSDQRESFALQSMFTRHGLLFVEIPMTSGSKEQSVSVFRRWLRDGEVKFTEHARLRLELQNFAEVPTPNGGFTYRARGTGHDDYAVLPLLGALSTGADTAAPCPRRYRNMDNYPGR